MLSVSWLETIVVFNRNRLCDRYNNESKLDVIRKENETQKFIFFSGSVIMASGIAHGCVRTTPAALPKKAATLQLIS